jgi:hypothetical protein
MAGQTPRHEAGERLPPRAWGVRVAWFIGIWLASIASLGAVAWIIRFWLVG